MAKKIPSSKRPPWWRPFARRRWREAEERRKARAWMRAGYEWQRAHPGVPAMEAVITSEGTRVWWNGPRPPWDDE